jgi:hypothetical protein
MYPDDLFSKSTRNDMNFVFDRMCRETALKTSAVKKLIKKYLLILFQQQFIIQSFV